MGADIGGSLAMFVASVRRPYKILCPVFPPILGSSLLQMGADIGGSLAMFVASASLATLAVLVAVLLLCLLKALATLIGTIILALPFLIAPLRNFCRMVLCS